MVIALQVDADDPNADIRTLHILKNRWSGMTGPPAFFNFPGKRADCAKMPWPSSNKNKKRMSTMQAANDNEAAWRDFHEANPNVYRLIERFTKQAIGAGFKHYGMMSIIQRVRWQHRSRPTTCRSKSTTTMRRITRGTSWSRTRTRGFLPHPPGGRCSMMRDLFEDEFDTLDSSMTFYEYAEQAMNPRCTTVA